MDRYQIAKRGIKALDGGFFRFPPTNTPTQIIRYIDHCTKNNASFMADNIALAVLEMALVKVSRLTSIPILVQTRAQARILSMAYSHKPVYSIECYDTIHPSSGNKAICYNCKPPIDVKPYIMVVDKLL